ncbi:MAG: hypothetical protein QNK31_00655 [Porticoccus sp.]|nr:hypothetical protein [Porticoccus sp.]
MDHPTRLDQRLLDVCTSKRHAGSFLEPVDTEIKIKPGILDERLCYIEFWHAPLQDAVRIIYEKIIY